MSVQFQMTVLLITLVSIMNMTIPSKFIPKQIILFQRHLLNLKSFCFHLSHRTFGYQLTKNNHILTPPLEINPIIESVVRRFNNPALQVRILTPTQTKVDKATR